MHLRLLAVSFGVALLAACAAPPPQDTQVAAQDTSACHAEYRTGTNIPIKTCTAMSEEERQLQKVQTDQVFQNLRVNPMKATSP